MKKIIFLFLGLISIFSLTSCNYSYVESNEEITLSRRNAISSDGENLSITANVTSKSEDKSVSWSLEWKDTGFQFGTGQWSNPTSYDENNFIYLEISEDTLTCNVRLIKCLPTTMYLYCTLNSNTSIKTKCNIEYVSRTIGEMSGGTQLEARIPAGGPGDNRTFKTLFDWSVQYATIEDEYDFDFKTGTSNYWSWGSLKGDVDMEVDYSRTFRTQDNYEFIIDFPMDLISEHSEIYEHLVSCPKVWVPVIYSVYYNGTLIQSDIQEDIYFNFS